MSLRRFGSGRRDAFDCLQAEGGFFYAIEDGLTGISALLLVRDGGGKGLVSYASFPGISRDMPAETTDCVLDLVEQVYVVEDYAINTHPQEH